MRDRRLDVQAFINRHPFSAFQWLVFAICFFIVLLDGFDTAAIGFIAPSLLKEWGELAQAIARVREQGYAVVDQELELGLRTIAVPLRNVRGDVVAAMNISVHAGRMSVEQMVERCLPALIKFQVELNALL